VSNWYQLDTTEVLQQLGVEPNRGLSGPEPARRLAEYGPNELIERGAKSPWRILWEQLTATMVVILIVAAVLSAFLGDYEDAIAILAIVVINAALGFNQEYRAERAMAALKKLAVPIVKVRRDGRTQEISARDLVPGDIVLLEAGNLTPADGRLLESANLRIQEAALTGESEPVEKETLLLAGHDLPLGDRRNMAYMGTVVTYGRGLAVITETGMKTELGKIASLIQTVEREPTPLQRRLDQLGKGLAGAALALVAVIFGLGLWRGEELRLMFLTGVSMAVAAVPEGLPAVVTIALALGAQRMLRRNALIRKLPAVETLGSVTVICSDKTGTLTQNRMTVTVLDVAGNHVDLADFSLAPSNSPPAEIHNLKSKIDTPALGLLAVGGALCNDAVLEESPDQPSGFHIVGDPTEAALVMAAKRMGLDKQELERVFPRVAELPFDSERKRMTTMHQLPTSQTQIPPVLSAVWDWGGQLGGVSHAAITKGAVDGLLDISNQVWMDDRAEPLTEPLREWVVAANNQMAQEGIRVLGVGFRPLNALPPKGQESSLEQELIFVGLIGMIDPARPEVKQAVQTCLAAGIRPVMITGDHPLTARHIARELGISNDERIVTGQELEVLPVEALVNVVEEVAVYARVAPEHKLKIVEALQERGQIVAMTGDGVNDAPALKKADIGVAMGITGTDVSKEAADMVLQDDNFATIVAAVEEGRVIYDNIRKFIRYLLTSNSGEIWVMLAAPFLGMPLPLLPLQILWINLVTDGLPALALSLEPAERNIMHRRPYQPNESVFGRGLGQHIIWVGVLIGLVSLALGYEYWLRQEAHWQTIVFTVLTLAQLFHVLAIRSERDSLFTIGLFSNRALLGAVLLTFLLQLAAIYLPFMQRFLETVALSIGDLVLCVLVSSVVFWAVELEKWWVRR
jgi:Ca2+-transporting ATPase